MTLILLFSSVLATFRTRKEFNVMRHHNSVFHSLLKHIDWSTFYRLVDEHGSDRRVRRLTTKSQFVALLYGQLSGASSLRDIVVGLESHASRLYHVGAQAAKRSTLSDANGLRPSAVFWDLFASMVARAHPGLRRKLGETTYLIDATGLPLNALSADWAFSTRACGAKLHVIYDADAELPIYAAVSHGRVNDITAAKTMPIEPGATYVFDLGYYDYAWWAGLNEAGCRIVTRFKKNTPLTLIAEQPVEEGGAILSDRIGHLPERQARNRRNPMTDPVREVRVRLEDGKVLRVLTNDLDAGATEIADLYKRRWAIELFFRWVKQHLKIKKFVGTSQNAIHIQIAVALIAYLIIKMAHASQQAIKTPHAFVRLVSENLMHFRPIENLLKPPPIRTNDQNQLAFKGTFA
jgi:hypothetical protein